MGSRHVRGEGEGVAEGTEGEGRGVGVIEDAKMLAPARGWGGMRMDLGAKEGREMEEEGVGEREIEGVEVEVET